MGVVALVSLVAVVAAGCGSPSHKNSADTTTTAAPNPPPSQSEVFHAWKKIMRELVTEASGEHLSCEASATAELSCLSASARSELICDQMPGATHGIMNGAGHGDMDVNDTLGCSYQDPNDEGVTFDDFTRISDTLYQNES